MNLLYDIRIELKDVNLLEKKSKNHRNLIKEFMAKTKLWKINWLNKNFDIGTSDDEYDTDIDFTNVPTSGTCSITWIVTQDSSSAYTVAINAVTVNGGGDVTAKTAAAIAAITPLESVPAEPAALEPPA